MARRFAKFPCLRNGKAAKPKTARLEAESSNTICSNIVAARRQSGEAIFTSPFLFSKLADWRGGDKAVKWRSSETARRRSQKILQYVVILLLGRGAIAKLKFCQPIEASLGILYFITFAYRTPLLILSVRVWGLGWSGGGVIFFPLQND